MKRIISALLSAVMLAGAVPAMPVFAEAEPVLLQAQRPEGVEYEEGLSYVTMGTPQSEVDESGRYILTVYRDGDTSKEASVDFRTADLSARYGVDYIVDDDNYQTDETETDMTLMEMSAQEERLEAGKEAMEDMEETFEAAMEGNVQTSENVFVEDEDAEEELPFTKSFDELLQEKSDARTLKSANPFSEGLDRVEEAKEENKSPLAKAKEEQSGLETRQTYDTPMQPLTSMITDGLGMDLGDMLETTSSTTMVFAPGEDEKQIIIKILEDDESEGQEIISCLLSNPGEDTVIGDPSTTSVVIKDDEPIVHSKLTFSSAQYNAENGKATISVSRSEALYSMVTAKVRTVETGTAKEGINFSKADSQITFRPYQEEVSFEIPARALEDMSFGLELYDLKGGEDGERMSATVNIKAQTAQQDSTASLFSEDGARKDGEVIKAGGSSYSLEFNGDVAKVMDKSKNPATQVGEYYRPTTSYVSYGYKWGDLNMHNNEYDANEQCGHLHSGKWWCRDLGGAYANFEYRPSKYQSVYLDFATYSARDGAHCGFQIWIDKKIRKDVTAYKDQEIRGPLKILRSDDTVPGSTYWHSNDNVRIYANRESNGLISPEMRFWGILMMFREYHVSIEQPDALEYKTPNGPIKKAPATVEIGRAHV